MYIKCTLSWLP